MDAAGTSRMRHRQEEEIRANLPECLGNRSHECANPEEAAGKEPEFSRTTVRTRRPSVKSSSLYAMTSRDSINVQDFRPDANSIADISNPEYAEQWRSMVTFDDEFGAKISDTESASMFDVSDIMSCTEESELSTFDFCDSNPESPPIAGQGTSSRRRTNSSYVSEHVGEELPELDFSPITGKRNLFSSGKPRTEHANKLAVNSELSGLPAEPELRVHCEDQTSPSRYSKTE